MSLQVGDILAVSFRASLFEQRIINVLHYKLESTASTGSSEADLQRWADTMAGQAAVANTPTNSLLSLACPEYNLDEVRVQRVYPARTIYAQAFINQPGTHAGNCVSPNQAFSILKRGNVPGRFAVGRVQIAGIPSNSILNGEVTVGYQLDLANFKAGFAATLNTIGPNMSMKPVIFNPVHVPHSTDIFEWVEQLTVRTMHRRTVRVGE